MFTYILGRNLLTFSDNFNRANSTTLGNDWIETSGEWQILSNSLNHVSGSTARCLRPVGEAFTDGWVQITLNSFGQAPCLRFSSSALSGYYALADNSPVQTYIFKYNAGVLTTLAQNATSFNGTTDVIKFQVQGSLFTVFKNGVSVLTATDTTFTGGVPGVYGGGGAELCDDFSYQEL